MVPSLTPPAGRRPAPYRGGCDPALAGLAAFAADAMTVCPYLGPSMHAGQTRWVRLPAPAGGGEAEEAAALLFTAGLAAGERVRARAAAGDRLACEVVALDWPASRPHQRSALAWPHWALKVLFAPVGVLCGKFLPAPSDLSEQPIEGADLVPPLVLALRVCVPARDARLLGSTPALARTVVSAVDDGRNVLAAVPGMTVGTDPRSAWPAVRAWAAARLSTCPADVGAAARRAAADGQPASPTREESCCAT